MQYEIKDTVKGVFDCLVFNHEIKVIRNMRDIDRAEISLLLNSDYPDVENICMSFLKRARIIRNFFYKGEAVATIVLLPSKDNVWLGGSWGTPLWDKVLKSVTSFIRNMALPLINEYGGNMIQVFSWSERRDVERWLCESCGFMITGEKYVNGKNKFNEFVKY